MMKKIKEVWNKFSRYEKLSATINIIGITIFIYSSYLTIKYDASFFSNSPIAKEAFGTFVLSVILLLITWAFLFYYLIKSLINYDFTKSFLILFFVLSPIILILIYNLKYSAGY
jgi:type III secretory pathway component EscU